MPRRRYISTEISVDARLNKVSDFAALFYTWAIPHAKDDCRISPQNAEELLLRVVPGRKKTVKQLETALNELLGVGLLGIDEKGEIFFPAKTFYKFQTYINAANRRETPQIASSLSPSPSVKEIHKSTPIGDNGFGEFWDAYPVKTGKGKAEESWKKRKPPLDQVLAAIAAQKAWRANGNGSFRPEWKHPATWLNAKGWLDEIEPEPAVSTEPYVDPARKRLAELEAERKASGKYNH